MRAGPLADSASPQDFTAHNLSVSKGRKWLIGCSIPVTLLGIGAIVLPEQRKAILAGLHLWQEGAFSHETHNYTGTTTENLRRIRTALMLYHDSEGQFPEASRWMDAAQDRLQTADLNKGEGIKKLVRPDLIQSDGGYGYAFNDACSKKYKDDLKDPKTILVFESNDTNFDAHGDPAKIRKGLAITIDGTILQP